MVSDFLEGELLIAMAPSKPEKPLQSRGCYERLRRLLLHGGVQPGIRLGEVDWARKLGVHRTALREAMALLAHDDLLRKGERGGYFTPLLEQRDLDEIWEVRQVIEVSALRIIGERAPRERERSRLMACCDAMKQMIEGGFELGFLEADRQFHQTLVKLTENERLLRLYNRAPLPITFSPMEDRQTRIESGLVTVAEHRQIVAALHERRLNEAVELLELHLHKARARVGLY